MTARGDPRAAPARLPAFLLAAGVPRAPAVEAAQCQRPARRGGRCQEPVLAVGASWPVPSRTLAPRARRQPQVLARQRRVARRAEKNVGDEVALVRARALAACDRVQSLRAGARAHDRAQVVAVIAHVAEARGPRLARIDLARLAEHEVEPPGVARDQPAFSCAVRRISRRCRMSWAAFRRAPRKRYIGAAPVRARRSRRAIARW